MIKTSRLNFIIIILLFVNIDGHAQSEHFIRSALTGELRDFSDRSLAREPRIAKSSNYYRLDLNFDTFKDGFLIKPLDHAQRLMIFDAKKELVQSFDLPYLGHRSGVLKFTLHRISRGKSLLVVFFSEGSVRYLKESSSVRSFFITFSGEIKKENIYFQKGPLLMKEFVDKEHSHLVTSFLDFRDLNGDGVKESILSKPRGNKSIYMLNGVTNQWVAY